MELTQETNTIVTNIILLTVGEILHLPVVKDGLSEGKI